MHGEFRWNYTAHRYNFFKVVVGISKIYPVMGTKKEVKGKDFSADPNVPDISRRREFF